MAEQAQHLLNIPAVVNQFLDSNLDARECVIDVLTEVLHFAHETEVDFDSALAMADTHFRAESGE